MSLNDLKVGTRLAVGFGVALLFLVAVGITGLWGVHRVAGIAERKTEVDDEYMEQAYRMQVGLMQMRRFEKDVIINLSSKEKQADYVKQFGEGKEQLTKSLADIEKLAETDKDKGILKEVRDELANYTSGFEKIAGQVREGKFATSEDANKAVGEIKKHSHKIEGLLNDMISNASKQADNNKKLIASTDRNTSWVIGLMILMAGLLTILLTVLFSRSVTKPLRETLATIGHITNGDLTRQIDYAAKDELGEMCFKFNGFVENLHGIMAQVVHNSAQVASAAHQLYSTSEQMATGAEEVAAQAGTVAAASEEMAATSGEIAQNCNMAAGGAKHANDAATKGATVVENTVSVMNRIAERVKVSARTVESLGERSDQIGAIIGTIEDIADQTNLLALNAAIEAARAGEHGRGFAVVADEVRALAERTTKATREIGDMIKAIQQETKGAVNAMEEGVKEVETGTAEATRSGQALQDILNRVNEVAMQVNQIATAAEQQTATTSEISNNVQQITEVVQETSKGAQESATAASQLARLAEELQRMVGQFKVAA